MQKQLKKMERAHLEKSHQMEEAGSCPSAQVPWGLGFRV